MSLRLRLVLATCVVALVALVAADFATYTALGSYLRAQLDSSMNQEHSGIEACLDAGLPPTAALLEGNDPGAFLEEMTATGQVVGVVPAFRFEDGSGAELIGPALNGVPAGLHPRKSGAAAAGAPKDCDAPTIGKAAAIGATTTTDATPDGIAAGAGEEVVRFTAGPAEPGGPSYRVRASTLANGNVMILATPLTQTTHTLDRLLLVEMGVTGGAFLLALLLGWWLVRLGMRTLLQIERTAEAITGDDLRARVPEAGGAGSEIGRLTRVLNSMLSRIEEAFAARERTERALSESEERMRRFLADASHELRTPLAAVSAYAELFERSSAEHPEDLPRILGGIRAESNRMSHLVGDLLLLANLDEGRPLERRSVELVSLSSRAVDAARAMGPQWPVQLTAVEPVEVEGDETRLRQVLDNLLANVRAHTPPGTAAEVRVTSDGSGMAEVQVVDHGPGFDQATRLHAFDRFYRGEPSRARVTGGSGLGLSIVGAIVAAHGGTVEASLTPGGGATFAVRIPLSREDGAGDPDEVSGRT